MEVSGLASQPQHSEFCFLSTKYIVMALTEPISDAMKSNEIREMDPSLKTKDSMALTMVTTFLSTQPTQQKFQREEYHTGKNNFTIFIFNEQRP